MTVRVKLKHRRTRVTLQMLHKHWLIVPRDPERCVRQTLLHPENRPQGGTPQGTGHCRALDYDSPGSQRRRVTASVKPSPGPDLGHQDLGSPNKGSFPRSLSQTPPGQPDWRWEAGHVGRTKLQTEQGAGKGPGIPQLSARPAFSASHCFRLTLAAPLQGALSDLPEALRTCHLPPTSACDQF